MSDRHDHVLIVGTGFAGLAMAIRLKQAGIHDFTILEQAPGIGGTWRENHYPGAACDVPSQVYSFSFALNPSWSRSFASQGEILAYMEHCVDAYGLRPHLRLGEGVTRAVFDERAGMWDVATSLGKTVRARVVVSGTGGLREPSYPEIPGLGTFAGKTFHSSRWDHSYSLEGKTVGVIGTGASAIQIIPEIAPKVGKLHLFQRTPPWILPKPDDPIGPLARKVYRRVPGAQRLARSALYWKLEVRALAFVVEPRILRYAEPIALKYLASRVADPELRRKLTPNYRMGCKRILMSNDYYEALQQPHVEVVADGIAEIRPSGVATRDGQERPLDALVLATGFHAADAVAPFEVRGRGGVELNETWRGGAEAYLGTTVAGFPNLFLIVGPNTGLGHNSMIFMIESQAAYVLDAIKTMRAARLKHVEVRRDAQMRYNATLQARLAKTIWHTGGCSSWYTTRDGKNTTLWPGFTVEYRLRTRRFDADAYELVADDGASSYRAPPRRTRASSPEPAGAHAALPAE